MRYYIHILILILLAGCASNESLNSFDKRKYTKGYFNDIPTERPGVLSKIANKPKPVEVLQNNMPVQQTRIVVDSAKTSNLFKDVVLSSNKVKHNAEIISAVKETSRAIAQVKDDKPVSDTKGTTNLADIGIVIVGIGVVIVSVLFLSILFTVISGGIFSMSLLAMLAFFLIIGCGWVICQVAETKANELPPKLAKTGADLGTVFFILFLVIATIGYFHIIL